MSDDKRVKEFLETKKQTVDGWKKMWFRNMGLCEFWGPKKLSWVCVET